jgi:hypothetical protein
VNGARISASSRIGRLGDIQRDREPVLLEQAGDDVGDRRAVFGIFMHQRHGVGLLAGGPHFLEEIEIDLGEIAGHRRGAEEPLKTRSMRLAGTDSPLTKGMPYFSAIALAASVMPDCGAGLP